MKTTHTKAFMAHIPLTEFDYLEEIIKEYNIVKYLIAYENEPYEHFHFVIEFHDEPDKNYHNFCKRVFKDKYKLRGQAKKNQPRQYGCLKKVENLERMCAYTIKDGNFRTNMEQTDIDNYIAISKETTKFHNFRDKIIEHLNNQNYHNPTHSFFYSADTDSLEKKCKKEVINYFLKHQETNKNMKLTKSFVENIYLEYLVKTNKLTLEEKTEAIYGKFFSFGI